MNWRQQQKADLGEALYESALRLFEAQGFDATAVVEITAELGVAKGTFFNHFPTKEHVIARWYNTITAKCLSAAKKRRSKTTELAVAGLFVDMSARATAAPELMLAKFRNVTNPLLMEAEKRQVDLVSEFVREQCVRGQERGELTSDVDTGFLADLLLAVLSGTSRAWASTEPRFDFPKLIRQRVRYIFRGNI